ncbi:MAG: hypothetical protein ACE5H1_01845 [Thermodesulfobacteriota bacterium]
MGRTIGKKGKKGKKEKAEEEKKSDEAHPARRGTEPVPDGVIETPTDDERDIPKDHSEVFEGVSQKPDTPQKPDGCVACEHFTQEGNKALVERGVGGKCGAKPDAVVVSQSVVRDKIVSNNCPLYPPAVETGPACKECDVFTPEKSIEKIRGGTGGYCGFNKGFRKRVPTHISNNDTIPNDCPKHKEGKK